MPAAWWLALALMTAALPSTSGQVVDLRGDRVNGFPVMAATEVPHGERVTVTIQFKIFFPVDDNRYAPVDDRLARLISASPDVAAETGMLVRVLKMTCTPRLLRLKEGPAIATVRGAVVECAVEVSPNESLGPGLHEVRFEFPRLDAAFRSLGGQGAGPKCEARLKVNVTVSREASKEAERHAQEQAREAERRAQEQAQEMERRARQEAEQRSQEVARAAQARRLQLLKIAGITLSIVLLTGLPVFLCRRWIWPTVKVEVVAGGHVQRSSAVPTLTGEGAEPGTIHRTIWATDWHGRRQRIKVEFFVASDGSEEILHEGPQVFARSHRRFEPESATGPVVSNNLLMDVLVSVAASAPPGMYLATSPNGAVRVRVLPGKTQ
jgi:hypothetical protein